MSKKICLLSALKKQRLTVLIKTMKTVHKKTTLRELYTRKTSKAEHRGKLCEKN